MTHYDTPSASGAFEASRQSFESLIGELRGENTATISHAELEELITGRGREMLRLLLQDHLDLRALREEATLTTRRAAGQRLAGRSRISDAARLPATRAEAAVTAARYLRGHAEYLCYDAALAAGWPIATGLIEGAARHLVADRLEITGSRWGLDGAEAILRLRAVISIGDFPDYWQHHLAREHHRVHPDDYQLAA